MSPRGLSEVINDYPSIPFKLAGLEWVKAGSLEAILSFGRSFFIYLFLLERSWKNMKNDTTFRRMRSSDHLGDTKMSKKGTSLRQI